MGQPKFPRKKYQTPNHPWQGDRIKAENEVKIKFGLKNKREIWRAQTRLRELRQQARTLVSRTRVAGDVQAAREADLLVKRLYRQGYVGQEATLNDVLGLDLERILNRRLQSQVYLKGLTRTMKQARQFVNHGLVRIGDRRVSAPSYVVRRDEETLISLDPSKAVADDDHPVRPKPEGFEARQEAAAAATTVQETKETARPDAHPSERNEAPAQASEEPNMTETPAAAEPEAAEAPTQTEEPAAEATPEPETKEPEATEAPAKEATPEPEATEAPAKEATPEPTPEPETKEPEATEAAAPEATDAKEGEEE